MESNADGVKKNSAEDHSMPIAAQWGWGSKNA